MYEEFVQYTLKLRFNKGSKNLSAPEIIILAIMDMKTKDKKCLTYKSYGINQSTLYHYMLRGKDINM